MVEKNKKYSIINNLIYSYKNLIKYEGKRYFVPTFFYIISGIAFPFMAILLPSEAVKLLSGRGDKLHIFLILSVYILFVGIASGFGVWMNEIFSALQRIVQNSEIMNGCRDFLEFGCINDELKDGHVNKDAIHEIKLENVSYKYPGDPKYAIKHKNAGLFDKVNNYPKKADTIILKELSEDGVDFSGGEMQKLMLARALYKDASVIVLDEPTAALDPIAESEMYDKYAIFAENKTSIFISHRMSSCRFCDDIIVFDKGKIVERGSHDELLSEDNYYASMWKAQSKYYA